MKCSECENHAVCARKYCDLRKVRHYCEKAMKPDPNAEYEFKIQVYDGYRHWHTMSTPGMTKDEARKYAADLKENNPDLGLRVIRMRRKNDE